MPLFAASSLILSAALSPLVAQASSPAMEEPLVNDQARLFTCLEQARTDPTTAIMTASSWSADLTPPALAYPQECLGMAYTRLLRWKAAEDAFLSAFQSTPETSHSERAKLAAMAGNSALADERYPEALADFSLALEEARSGNNIIMAGETQIDRARALVAIGQTAQAVDALADARRDAPQNADGWLLSATLSRRINALGDAQAQIETAAALDPANPAIGLEAGLIAALGGRDDAARQSWRSVVASFPDSPEADTARAYLDQLDPLPEGQTGR